MKLTVPVLQVLGSLLIALIQDAGASVPAAHDGVATPSLPGISQEAAAVSQSAQSSGQERSPAAHPSPTMKGAGKVSAATERGSALEPDRVSPFDESGFNFYVTDDSDTNSGEIRRLELDVARLTAILSETQDARRKAEITGRIEAALQQQFDLRQQSREEELRGLEDRVRKLRENFEKRQSAKAVIVKHRLEEIQRDAEGLGWGGRSTPEPGVQRPFSQSLSGNAFLLRPAPAVQPATSPVQVR